METNVNNGYSFFSFLPVLFKENGLEKEIRHLAKYEYFLKLVSDKQTSEEIFVPISNKILRKVIRQELITRIKNNLFHLGIIECNFRKRFEKRNGKIIGKESYSYRLTKQYFVPINSKMQSSINGDGLEVNQTTGTLSSSLSALYNRYGLDKKVERARKKFQEKVSIALRTRWHDLMGLQQKPEYNFIYRNTFKVGINPEAFSWIDDEVKRNRPLKDSTGEFINSKGEIRIYMKRNRTLTPKIAQEWKDHLQRIQNKDFQFNCPSSVNRVFYNITSMPGELRKFLCYKNQELVYLDYSNFQPLLFVKYILDSLSLDSEEVSKYIAWASEGRFYKEVKKMIIESNVKITDEVNFKTDFFARVFFSSEKRKYKYRTAFAHTFPNVSRVITETKGQNHKSLAVSLQRMEAEIVINTVFHQLAQKYSNCFALPVHDAIICEASMKEIILNLMIEAVRNKIGCMPDVKVEPLNFER
ncbi:MAG: hypothetical protein JST26_09715 [Bacteroidetes bacterium]|nr:hypothetical protein [Bacteroidota bacterium]